MEWGVTIDVGTWLRDLGLGRYEASFRENEIDEQVLAILTQEDLKEITSPKPAHTADREAVGRRLRIFRRGLGLTLAEMSAIVGSPGHGQLWCNYEKGRRLIPVETANKLTLLYGLDINWIYQGRLDQLGPRLSEIIQRGETLIAKPNPRGRPRKETA